MPIATSDELALYLGIPDIDATRADLLLGLAQSMAESRVYPLPAGAKAIVLSAAGRAYANPQGVSAETVGPYSVTRPPAGLYLTKSEKVELGILAGRGGAFSFDPTPVDAGTGMQPWDENVLWLGEVPLTGEIQ